MDDLTCTLPSNPNRISDLAAKGRAVIARMLGRPFSHIRPVGSDFASFPSIGAVKAHFDRDPAFRAKKAALYNDRTEYAAVTAPVEVGDYLVSDTATYFVVTPDDLTPATVVRCNERVTISRPASQTGMAAYQGNTAPVVVARDWLVRMTIASKGDSPLSGLPEVVKQSNKEVLMPSIAGVSFQTSYEIRDSQGIKWKINAIEQSHLGLRLQVEQASVS
jgi:hypothetical protein